MKVDAKHNLLYATHTGTEHTGIAVVRNQEVITNITLPGDPREIAIDETHNYVYVANVRRGELVVLRGTEVVTTLSTEGRGPWDIGVDEKRGYIYVSNADSHSISVFTIGDNSWWQNSSCPGCSSKE